MTDSMIVFDRTAKRLHRDRAAERLDEAGFLFEEGAERLADRLSDIRRGFPVALDLGCHDGTLARVLAGRGGIETLIQADLSPVMAARAAAQAPALVCDEEALPFAADSLDLVLSNLSLHWVNDLPGALVQINRALKRDGLLLLSMFGGGTLAELRDCLTRAELETEGGAGPRVSPFVDIRDLGNLLQRAGFALPVVDAETITVRYENPLRLFADLRAMGESNAVAERRKRFSRRATLLRAAQLYQELYGGEDGRVPATFTLLFAAAWTPHPDQPRALRPGCAITPLAEALSED